MRTVRRFLTALALSLTLLISIAGSEVTHAVMADHQGSVPVSAHTLPDADSSQSPYGQCPASTGPRGMPMTASCCPGLAVPMRSDVLCKTSVVYVAWHSGEIHDPATRLIGPEPPPPKSI